MLRLIDSLLGYVRICHAFHPSTMICFVLAGLKRVEWLKNMIWGSSDGRRATNSTGTSIVHRTIDHTGLKIHTSS